MLRLLLRTDQFPRLTREDRRLLEGAPPETRPYLRTIRVMMRRPLDHLTPCYLCLDGISYVVWGSGLCTQAYPLTRVVFGDHGNYCGEVAVVTEEEAAVWRAEERLRWSGHDVDEGGN